MIVYTATVLLMYFAYLTEDLKPLFILHDSNCHVFKIPYIVLDKMDKIVILQFTHTQWKGFHIIEN